ncbi:glutathione synthetase ATP-binding domain-like protein [Aspergillus granulosus]|uniref:Glutathione synthetase ATP-binding domain-like protein n=1 Tax=Aspergillus granulosus TaxID=176169 RepID=A0ABR4I3T7_9EURO
MEFWLAIRIFEPTTIDAFDSLKFISCVNHPPIIFGPLREPEPSAPHGSEPIRTPPTRRFLNNDSFNIVRRHKTSTMLTTRFGRRHIRAVGDAAPTVAVLFQAIEPPVINGVQKPRKPGGYQDSGADIAYTLQQQGIRVIKPDPAAPVSQHEGWSFPDTDDGIYAAVQKGATHFWANTILFSSHPLQTSNKLTPLAEDIYVIGQPPGLVENFDDKAYLNGKLRELGKATLPKSWLVESKNIPEILQQIDRYPIVGKPVRGRGSHGVKVCRDKAQLEAHINTLLSESPLVMLEEFLAGEEATITVMPPTPDHPTHWSLVPVTRFNHDDGIAPYNGVVAVTANSRVVAEDELKDPAYGKAMRQCEEVAKLIGATAPIRVDVRRFEQGSDFALFDINMKPNMTGPGRPGREDQASLTAIAAAAMGWNYGTLLENILAGAQPLSVFRKYRSPF